MTSGVYPKPAEIWTPERITRLQALHLDGLSCSQIAEKLGVSRNAVIGKAHRMGLQHSEASKEAVALRRAASLAAPKRAPKPRAPKPKAPPKLVAAPPPRPISVKATVYDPGTVQDGTSLKASAWLPLKGQTPVEFGTVGVCRWPIELAGDPRLLACGAKKDPTSHSYCCAHARRSGGPAKPIKQSTFDHTRARRAA